ncbi:hypothetical protein NQZ68_001499 [Dissostichus eleginoides]|nr:hypothetical protein NQZ68_001499 [Dissostichus eleginoides]
MDHRCGDGAASCLSNDPEGVSVYQCARSPPSEPSHAARLHTDTCIVLLHMESVNQKHIASLFYRDKKMRKVFEDFGSLHHVNSTG